MGSLSLKPLAAHVDRRESSHGVPKVDRGHFCQDEAPEEKGEQMDCERLTILDWHIQDSKLEALVKRVIRRIPPTFTDEFPSFSVVEGPSRWGAHVEPMEKLIVLDASKLTAESDDVAAGTVAHELAHVFLGTGEGGGGLENEFSADEVARTWGFVGEVDAMRRADGPPTLC